MALFAPLTDADLAAHNASWAIPALLTDEDLVETWPAHWRAFEAYASPGLWYDRFRELLCEAQHRQITLSRRHDP